MMTPSFEHGIDHVGQRGVAPLLVLGGAVTASDFEMRDLRSIQGVVISERGLPKNIGWSELNLRLVGERLPHLRYLWVEYSRRADLNDIGPQRNLTYLKLLCPKLTTVSQPLFPTEAEFMIPDAALFSLLAPSIESLTVIRPKFRDLQGFLNCGSIRSLDIHYGRNLASLAGLSNLPALEWLGLHDCPAFQRIGTNSVVPGPVELMLGGCKRFSDFSGLEYLTKLRKVSLFGKGPRVVIPRSVSAARIEVDVRGREIDVQ